MSRSRIHLGALKTQRWSTRHKSTLQDLTRQSRVKPPGPNPPSTYKSSTAKVSRVLQWTLVPSEFSRGSTKPARSNMTQGVFGYMALYGDFGEHEHIFSPVSPSDYAHWAALT